MRPTRLWVTALVLPLLGCAPAAAGAQPIDVRTSSSATERVPLVTVGVGAGTAFGESGPATLLSLQIPIGRYVLIESETTRRVPGRWELRTLTTGANVLLRAGTRHVIGFVGGGMGVQRTTVGWPPVPYPRTSLVQQVIGGIDLPLGRQMIGFAAVRAGSAPEDGIRALAGLRLPIGARPLGRPPAIPERVTAAMGKEVRVTAMDGSRAFGRLVSLTESDVVYRTNGQDVSVLLRDVRKVEKVSHGVRNGVLIGAAVGALPWIEVAATRDSCADCEDGPYAARLMTLVAVGAGAGVGAIVNATRADGNLLYQAPGPVRSVGVAPILSPRRQGAAVSLSW